MFSATLFVLGTIFSSALALPLDGSEENSKASSEDIVQLNEQLDEKLQLLAAAFRNNAMDPMNIKIAYMPEKGPVRRWALKNALHKDKASEFIIEKAEPLPETEDEFILVPLDGENTDQFVEYNTPNGKLPDTPSSTTGEARNASEREASLEYPKTPNAQLFGLSDMVRNGSVTVVLKNKTELIVCPVSLGPFRLVMTSPNLEDPMHATHALAQSIPVEMTFKREKSSLVLTKLKLPRIAAKQTIVFLSKTEKFASKKDELNAARLATHLSLELSQLWSKEKPLYEQITSAFRNFFNV